LHTLSHLGQPFSDEHWSIGQRTLQMGVAGDDHLGMAGTQADEGLLEAADIGGEGVDLIAEPEADVDGDLVVPGAGGVEAAFAAPTACAAGVR
jgi:hypothetical protein